MQYIVNIYKINVQKKIDYVNITNNNYFNIKLSGKISRLFLDF